MASAQRTRQTHPHAASSRTRPRFPKTARNAPTRASIHATPAGYSRRRRKVRETPPFDVYQPRDEDAANLPKVVRTVELATILLTDLVASTSTAARLGPERADRLPDDDFAVLREGFHRFGGREFKNSGDGLWAAFSSASAAVNCAVHIQQALERRFRDSVERPRVRIGLSAGESTIDDGDY